MSNLNRGPSKDASCQEDFLEINQSEIKIACGGCLLTVQNEMTNLYRGPSKDASCQISIYLAKRFQRRRFVRSQPIRNKNCL
jgi:hypothetical protein